MSYIQRDGVARDGESGRLYSAGEDEADGRAFLERSSGDRHQFRLIVSAEDGAQYEDLKPLVRRFMERMEDDLGTGLDWVAADHVDTLHPHTHIMLRGKDEQRDNLVIAPDYIKHGMRERLAGLVSLDLGPRSDLEIERRLRLDVEAERVTSLDRRLLRDAGPGGHVTIKGRDMADHSLLTGRLRKLGSLGLAEQLGGGRWQLSEDLQPVLQALGERGDIIRTLQRALTAAGIERAPADQLIFHPEGGSSVTGRIIERGLADELRDRHYLVVDGIDGRSHHVTIGRGEEVEALQHGAIVRIAPRVAAVHDSDHRIAAVAAAHGGRYSTALHVEDGVTPRYAQAHERRLEAIRRAVGGVERSAGGNWFIPPDFIARAELYEALRTQSRPVDVELLSAVPLDRLPGHDGATWLDHVLASAWDEPRDADLRFLEDRPRFLSSTLLRFLEWDVQGRVGFPPALVRRMGFKRH